EVVTEEILAARAIGGLKKLAARNCANHRIGTNLPVVTTDQKLLVVAAKKPLRQRNSTGYLKSTRGKMRLEIEEMMVAERIPELVSRIDDMFAPIDARGWSNRSQLERV